nr:discoidin domain-containing protein [Bacteroides sp. 51]
MLAQHRIQSLESSNPGVTWQVTPQHQEQWIDAVVPGTVFVSYVEAGLEKDPNFGDNIYQVDKAKYDCPFMYRCQFDIPTDFTQEKIWLNFRGINRRGEITLNGKSLGILDGFMQRGKFDITDIARRNEKNILTVRVEIPEHPLNNYGTPTYISSGGWDWMPYVPGLNSGITDKVFLSNTGGLLIEDPWIRTDLPTNARAELSLSFGIKNPTQSHKEGTLKVKIQPGNIEFSQRVNANPGRTTEYNFDKSALHELIINNPRLWWPNGYGEPHLYVCDITLEVDGKVSETQQIKFGIRKYTYDTEGDVLHVSINGKRVFLKGGNWGMSEYLLRCRGNEYDTKVQLHKEMNFNIIRNWLGSTTDDEFYEACDKYGILVWDDFWLNANPNLPSDIHCFNRNAIEKILRIRNHPCVAVWCGNNEGYPVAPLKNWLKENIATFDGNDRYYQPISNAESLSGSGVWGNFDPRWYFTPYPKSMTLDNATWGLRTEIGTAVFVNYESLIKFMPKDKLWPRNEMWNQHFFGQWAFNATPDKYDESIAGRYGTPESIEDYCRKAQLLNIETNQAMYEGWLDNMWEDASGIMTWMSQSAYPSMVWQTYDYYYDLTGAYWGVKKSCEPMHIQWNPATNSIKVINSTAKDMEELTAEASVYNSDGSEVTAFRQSATIQSYSNTATHCFYIPFYEKAQNIALGKPATASSSDTGRPEEVTDNNLNSRWSSHSNNNEWIYIDLQKQENIFGVGLNWEKAYGKKYKIQVSDDAQSWKDVSTVTYGRVGIQKIYFDDIKARYVRMQGMERGTGWGYSLWDFKVYGGMEHNKELTDVHFIKLRLKDHTGKTISENMYWRGTNRIDFTALNALPKANLKVTSQLLKKDGKAEIQAVITQPKSAKSVAFAVHVQAIRTTDGERILPAIINENYFTLMSGESKKISIAFDEALLQGGSYKLEVRPYNR